MESYVGGHFGCSFKHFPSLIDLKPFLYGKCYCFIFRNLHQILGMSPCTGHQFMVNWEYRLGTTTVLVQGPNFRPFFEHFHQKQAGSEAEKSLFGRNPKIAVFVSGQNLDDIISSERISVIGHLCTTVFSHGTQCNAICSWCSFDYSGSSKNWPKWGLVR